MAPRRLAFLVTQATLTLTGLVVHIIPTAIAAVGIVAADVAANPVDAGGAVATAELAAGQGDLLSFILFFHDSFLLCNGDDIRSDGGLTLD